MDKNLYEKALQSDGTYKCPECGKVCGKAGLGGHYWKKHTEEGKAHKPTLNKPNWAKGLNASSDSRIQKMQQSHIEKQNAKIVDGRKKCKACGNYFKLDEFDFRGSSTTSRYGNCRSCRKTYQKDYFEKNGNKPHYRPNAKDTKAAITRANQQKICEYLTSHPCIDCGETDIVVLQFDHRKHLGNKVREISVMVTGYGWDTILQEIKKCEVRCANCHTRRHAKKRNFYTTKFQVAEK